MAKGNTISYFDLLRARGAKANLLLGMVGRLPVSTAGVAILVAVSASSGSPFFSGVATAVYVLVSSIAAPFWSHRMDVLGQQGILKFVGFLQGFMWFALALACTVSASYFLLIACCIILGALSLDIGSVVRVRWKLALVNEDKFITALFIESTVDEVMFALSPILVTLAATVSPTIAPAVVGLGPIVGWTGLGMHKHGMQMIAIARTSQRKWNWGNLPWLFMLIFLTIGCLLGSIEVLLVNNAMKIENPISAGLALAAWASGSSAVALLLGPKLAIYDQRIILLVGLIVMTSFTSLLVIANSSLLTLIICFIAGTGAAPTFSAGFALVSIVSKDGQLTENLSWLTSCMGVGTTIGIFAASTATIYFHLSSEFFVPVVFGIVATLITSVAISR